MVTFLFSDVEGSTLRWERYPDAMSQALRRHDTIVQGAIDAHAGTIFKTLGDGFCALFERAADAIAAAVAAQRAISAEDWSAVGGLTIRIALHSGEAEQRDSDFFGPAVNRVARLLAAAHGGQIVLSRAAADAVRPSLPRDTECRPLGTFTLKDLHAPERIYQLVVPGLAADFKALRTLEAVPNNLPVQSTTLVGRRSDIAAVSDMLRRAHLVTIAGPGGAGKTRVALQCAADAIDRVEHGAWFVDLAPIVDESLVPATVLAALDVGAAPEGREAAVLIEHLRSREVLLLIDNCEHVIRAAASLVAEILKRCPRVTVLATSREVLHVAGEHVYRLGPLELDDAAELFSQRAAAVAPDFDASEHADVIRRICTRLDDIPLAIELAAARARSLTVAQIDARLEERFRLLVGGARTALPRQQTLAALIEWSYDLLTEEEQTLLRRTSVFHGSFSLQAATAVCAATREPDEYLTLDLLTSLADKSLVTTLDSQGVRYRFLETIRDYAAGKAVQANESGGMAQRHAFYFAREAESAFREFDSHASADWLQRLSPDLDNFRAALRWAFDRPEEAARAAQMSADCAPMFMRLQLFGEGLRWCESGRAVGSPDVAGRIEYVASMLHNNAEEHRRALECAERAVEAYRRSGERRGLVRALSQTAQLSARAGRFEEARKSADDAVRNARELGDPQVLAVVLRRCAFSLAPAEIETARALFGEAIAVARAAGESEEACRILEWWAEREAAAGAFERAMQLASEGLTCADRGSRMCLDSNIAGYALACGQVENAGTHARSALALALELRHRPGTAIALAYYAPCHAERDPEQAAQLFGYANARMDELEWQPQPSDRIAIDTASRLIEERVPDGAFEELFARGSSMNEEEALAMLSPALALR